MLKSDSDSWLEEQSFLTDSSYREVIDVSLNDDKYLASIIREVNSMQKLSKVSFFGGGAGSLEKQAAA